MAATFTASEVKEVVASTAVVTPGEKKQHMLPVSCSEAFATAVKDAAEKANENVSAYCRAVLASHIGYDLSAEETPTRGPRSIYASEADRKVAQAKKAKETRDAGKALLSMLASGGKLDATKLSASIGVDASVLEAMLAGLANATKK